MKQIDATVVKVEPYTPRYVRMRLYAPEIAASFQAGQFLMARCGDGYSPYLRRMLFPAHVYSAVGDKSANKLDVIFYPDEPGLNWLSHLPPSAEVDIVGALGRGFKLNSATRRLLLLAQGDYIIPLLTVLTRETVQNMEVVLIVESVNREMVFPPALLPRRVEYNIATLDSSWGYHGGALDIASDAIVWADQIYAAGENIWYSELHRVVERERFKISRGFAQVVLNAPMACGMGVCMGCAVETARGMRRVCVDGPVFDLRDCML